MIILEKVWECESVFKLTAYSSHSYQKNIDCLSFVVCLLLAPHIPRYFPFFAAAINSTNEANKAGAI
jgi:hypothetical protein